MPLWVPLGSALIAAIVAIGLWLAKESRERTKERNIALSMFSYFTHALAKALRHPAERMSHVDLALLNEHLPVLMAEMKDFDTALREVHDCYLKWRLDSYVELSADSDELKSVQQLLESHSKTAKQLLRLGRQQV